MARPPLGPLVALVIVQIAFATLPVAGKEVLEAGVPSVVLAGIRVAFAAILLAGIALLTQRERIERLDLAKLFGLSLLGVTVNILLFLEGLRHTTPINAAVLIATIPVFTLLVALLLRRERFHLERGLGIGLALVGTLIMLRFESFSLSDGHAYGALLITLNCLSYGSYLVLVRSMLQKYRSSTVVAWTFLLSALVLAPLAAGHLGARPTPALGDGAVMALLAWIVLVPSVLSYSLNNYALKRVPSSTVASFVLLQPLATVALAFLIRDDVPEWRTVLAAVPIVLGVIVVARSERGHVPAGIGKPINDDSRAPGRGRPQPEPEEGAP